MREACINRLQQMRPDVAIHPSKKTQRFITHSGILYMFLNFESVEFQTHDKCEFSYSSVIIGYKKIINLLFKHLGDKPSHAGYV